MFALPAGIGGVAPAASGGGGGLYTIEPFYPTTCYSTVRRRSGYTGKCMAVLRSSDNAVADIGFDANGVLDTVALLAHVGAGDGFVFYWYDQATSPVQMESAGGLRPRICSAGVVDTLDGLPAPLFSRAGTDDGMFVAFTDAKFGMGTGAWTVEAVALKFTQASPQQALCTMAPLDGQDGSFQVSHSATGAGISNKFYYRGAAAQLQSGGIQMDINTTYSLCMSYVGGASSTLRKFMNGGIQGSVNLTLDFTSSRRLKVGVNHADANGWDGYITDVLITKGVCQYTADYTPRPWAVA